MKNIFFIIILTSVKDLMPIYGYNLIQVVTDNLLVPYSKCSHLTVVLNGSSPASQGIVSFFTKKHFAITILDFENEYKQQVTHEILKKIFHFSPSKMCETFLIAEIESDGNRKSLINFLTRLRLHLWPDIIVVFLGPRNELEETYSAEVFKNVKQWFFVAYIDLENVINIYKNCLYCDARSPKIKLLETLKATNNFTSTKILFSKNMTNFNGHNFRVVAMEWFPVFEGKQISEAKCAQMLPTDSIDSWMLKEISQNLNFTYTIRLPCDNQWGTSTSSGNWTGIIGTLQSELADFSLLIAMHHSSSKVVKYSRSYTIEPMVMISLKPQPLSKALAVIRPFSGTVWLLTLTVVVIGAMVLKLASTLAFNVCPGLEGGVLSPLDAFLIVWRLLLSQSCTKVSPNVIVKVIICFILLWCTILAIYYRSMLSAHLIFPSQSVALESADELISRNSSWTWGYEPTYGLGWEWFKTNDNPTLKTVFNGFEVFKLDTQMEKVLRGNHAFITFAFYIQSIILSNFTNRFSYTPIHIAKEKFVVNGGYAWAYRQGAPFKEAIDLQTQRIIEAGLIEFWYKILEQRTLIKNRKKQQEEKSVISGMSSENSELVVLSMDHLQSAFYMLAIGFCLGVLLFLLEIITHHLIKWNNTRRKL